MTELTPDAKLLLAQLRAVDNPTARERASGDAAVRSMLEAHGVVGLPPLAANRAARAALHVQRANDVPALAARGGAGTKLAWSAAAVLVAALGLYTAQSMRAPSAPHPPQPASAAPEQPRAASAEAPAAPASAPRELTAREDAPAAAGSSAHSRRGAAKPSPSSLSDELKFLASVDAELRSGGYDHALQRLARHKGSPVLAEERAALRVLALCGRDNDAAAARARDHFLRGAPSSVLAARVRSACRAELEP